MTLSAITAMNTGPCRRSVQWCTVAGVALITVDDVGLGEAWDLWRQGMSLDGLSLWGVSILLAVSLFLLAYPRILSFLVLGFGRLIENPRSERVIRLLGVVLLLSGFHFDLLAS
jgi:hypothetical protein